MKKNNRSFNFFVGIDVSKSSIDIYEINTQLFLHTENSKKGFNQMKRFFKDHIQESLVVLEATGGYEQALIDFLLHQNIPVHRADTLKVKDFIRSRGRQAKTDKLDAKALANYGSERHLELPLYQSQPPYQKKLKIFFARREDLKEMLVKEKNRLQSPLYKDVKASVKLLIRQLERAVGKIDLKIKEVVDLNTELKQKLEVMKTVPGVGDIVASSLLACMPEIGSINKKSIAALAGLAPYANDSGKARGYRSIRGGRKEVRKKLFVAAMAASRSHSHLKTYYERLIQRGKKPMVALTALMRKILIILNARVAELELI